MPVVRNLLSPTKTTYYYGRQKYQKRIGNTISSMATASQGWKFGLGVGLLYSASYAGWEALLTRSESYNKVMHGENSPIYKSRRHHWIKKSKLYTGEQ